MRGLKLVGYNLSKGTVCRTPPGVRGLKPILVMMVIYSVCRTPPGVRGLKHDSPDGYNLVTASHPARGAWIETQTLYNSHGVDRCRTPPGVRGLKQAQKQGAKHQRGRTPPGVRGLKLMST